MNSFILSRFFLTVFTMSFLGCAERVCLRIPAAVGLSCEGFWRRVGVGTVFLAVSFFFFYTETAFNILFFGMFFAIFAVPRIFNKKGTALLKGLFLCLYVTVHKTSVAVPTTGFSRFPTCEVLGRTGRRYSFYVIAYNFSFIKSQE